MSTSNIPYKIYLSENEIPKAWYNLRADMKNKPAPLLNPGTGQPLTAAEMSGIFCEELVAQELDNDTAFIEIPEDIRSFYKMYRPSPLVQPQAQLRRGTGLLCQEAGPEGRHHRDRRRPVGHGPVHGLQLLRA